MDGNAYFSEVVIEGNKRTKLVYFQRILSDAGIGTTAPSNSQLYAFATKLKRNREPVPIDVLQNQTALALQILQESGLFDELDTKLELRNVRRDNVPEATVVISVREKGIPYLSVQSFVKTNSTVGAEIRGALRSPLGYGETFKVSFQNNPILNTPEYLIGMEVPRVGRQFGAVSVAARMGKDRQTYFSSYDQEMKTLILDYITPNKAHRFSLECSLRNELPILDSTDLDKGLLDLVNKPEPRMASVSILKSVASSWKSSFKHVGTFIDDRNEAISPSSGSLLQSSTEIAFPPGQAQFLKAELLTQHHKQIGPTVFGQPGLVVSMSSCLGLLFPFSLPATTKSNTRSSSYLSDRFHIGGPFSLRGFMPGGIGPRSYSMLSDDSLGGDTKAQCLCLASYPIPIKEVAQAGLRVFGFVNAGSVGTSQPLERLQQKRDSYPLFGYPRVSVGVGCCMGFGNMIRLEATYAVPLVKEKEDHIKQFQIGVGLTIG